MNVKKTKSSKKIVLKITMSMTTFQYNVVVVGVTFLRCRVVQGRYERSDGKQKVSVIRGEELGSSRIFEGMELSRTELSR